MRRQPIPTVVFTGVIMAAAVGALAACGSAGGSGSVAENVPYSAPPPPLPTSLPANRLDSGTGLASLDGGVVAELVGGQLVFRHGGSADGDPPPGVEVGPGAELRALSADGSLAALMIRLPDDRTRIVVVADPTGPAPAPTSGPSDTFDLDGLVEPEAFATDGSLLFVIDHQAGAQPGTYRVRPLDLATGSLQDALGPTKIPLEEDMRGRGVRQVWSPDGTRLYTLYLRQSPHGGGEPTVGLVHVLDLVEEWAYCIDLPAGFGAGAEGSAALAVSPDSTTLAVVDGDAGRVAFVETDNLAVVDTAPLPVAELLGPGPASSGDAEMTIHLALTTDRLVVAGGDRIRWLDRSTLAPLGLPDSLRSPARGLTSQEQSVLVWPADGAVEPYQLTPPSAP